MELSVEESSSDVASMTDRSDLDWLESGYGGSSGSSFGSYEVAVGCLAVVEADWIS